MALGLLDKVTNYLALREATKRVQNDPIFRVALARSGIVFDSIPLFKQLKEETKNAWADQLLQRIAAISSAPDKIARIRIEIGDAVVLLSQCQVLVIEPAPAPDPTGLRGTQGVSGELKEHVLEIALADKDLHEKLYGSVETPTFDDAWNLVLLLYYRSYWWAEVMNAIRHELKDSNPVDGRDWYWPFLHAMCVTSEQTYRMSIGLPSACGDSGEMVSLIYSSFLNGVVNGQTYPDLSWREHFSEDIQSGLIHPPSRNRSRVPA